MSSGAFARGAHSMFFKPGMIRKACHRKSSTSSTSSDKTMKFQDSEETKMNKSHLGDGNMNNESSCCWIPDERTGIYYPKGQERVIDGIPQGATKDFDVINYFSHN